MSWALEPYIETVSGREIYFLEPTAEMFTIEDIAHALSNTCRYTGHCNRFYSVAEHSVHVSNLLSGTGLELDGLLHDAAEAYLPDVASPIKQFLPDYNAMEDRIIKVIFEKYGLEYPFHPAVKVCDLQMLSTEAHSLIPSRGDTWVTVWGARGRPKVANGIKPSCVEPKVARTLFLERYKELTEVNAT